MPIPGSVQLTVERRTKLLSLLCSGGVSSASGQPGAPCLEWRQLCVPVPQRTTTYQEYPCLLTNRNRGLTSSRRRRLVARSSLAQQQWLVPPRHWLGQVSPPHSLRLHARPP